jgi:hypothetical protein
MNRSIRRHGRTPKLITWEEAMAQYKTIVLELMQGQPNLHEQLRKERLLLKALDSLAADLKTRHDYWMDRLSMKKPDSDAVLIASEALEMAIEELRERFVSASAASGAETEPLSLDEAMEYARLHTPTE